MCSVGDTVLFSVLQIDFISVIVCRQLPGAGQNDSEETERFVPILGNVGLCSGTMMH